LAFSREKRRHAINIEVFPNLCSNAQADSDRLLQETGEALEAQLSLEGVQDIPAMLRALDEGRALHPLHLTAIASTLLAAKAVEDQIQPQ